MKGWLCRKQFAKLKARQRAAIVIQAGEHVVKCPQRLIVYGGRSGPFDHRSASLHAGRCAVRAGGRPLLALWPLGQTSAAFDPSWSNRCTTAIFLYTPTCFTMSRIIMVWARDCCPIHNHDISVISHLSSPRKEWISACGIKTVSQNDRWYRNNLFYENSTIKWAWHSFIQNYAHTVLPGWPMLLICFSGICRHAERIYNIYYAFVFLLPI